MLRWITLLVIGFWQLFAILDGLECWYGFHGIIATIVSFFIAQIPVVGTIIGMNGAVDAWYWSWPQATLLFFGPFFLMLIVSLVITAIKKAID